MAIKINNIVGESKANNNSAKEIAKTIDQNNITKTDIMRISESNDAKKLDAILKQKRESEQIYQKGKEFVGALSSAKDKVENFLTSGKYGNNNFVNTEGSMLVDALVNKKKRDVEQQTNKLYEDNNKLWNEATQAEKDAYLAEKNNKTDFNSVLKELGQQRRGYQATIDSKEDTELAKENARKGLTSLQGDIDYYEKLKKLDDAYNENYTLDYVKENGSEEDIRNYGSILASKNDNVIERSGEALLNLGVKTLNTGVSLAEQLVETTTTKEANDELKRTLELYENGEISDEQYERYSKIWQGKINKNLSTNEDKVSQTLRDISNQLSQETYIGTNDIEKFMLQAGESTAQFLLHYALFGAGATLSMSAVSATEQFDKLAKITNENGERVYDTDTIVTNSLLTGLASYITEKIGMDNFVNVVLGGGGANVIGHLITSVKSQALAEGLEEVVEGLVDPFIDAMTLGKPYEVDGQELLMEFLLGATSGAFMGVAGGAKIIVNTKQEYNLVQSEVNYLESLKSQMNPFQQRRADLVIQKGRKAMADYEAQTTIGMAVSKASDFIPTSDIYQDNSTVVQGLTPNINEEIRLDQEINRVRGEINRTSQNLLSRKGIDIRADEYYNMDANLRNQIDDVASYAQKLGRKVVFEDLEIKDGRYALTDDGKLYYATYDGFFDPKTGDIVINPYGKRSVLSTFTHELTHSIENTSAYSSLVKALEERMKDSVVKDKAYIKKALTTVDENGNKVVPTDEIVNSEYVAIKLQDLLGDTSFIKDLARKNSSLAYNLYNSVKEALGMMPNDDLIEIKKNFENAFEEASREKTYEDIVKNSEGLTLEDIENKYKDKTNYLYLVEHRDGTISIDNINVKKDLRSKGIGQAILDDVIDYADKNGKTITLTPTKEFNTQNKLKKWYKRNGFVENKGRNTDFSIMDTMYRLPQNIKFSNGISLEEFRPDGSRKDLLAIHNLSEEQLLKSLDLGGFAMPSIAITKDTIGHDKYGNITLIFDKETINPSNSDNKVYANDAWTPTYPTREYHVEFEAIEDMMDRIGKLSGMSTRELNNIYSLTNIGYDENLDEQLQRNDGNLIDVLKKENALKYAYLLNKGNNIELPMKNDRIGRLTHTVDDDTFKILFKVFKENGITLETLESLWDANEGSRSFSEIAKRLNQPVTDAINEQYIKDNKEIDDRIFARTGKHHALYGVGKPRGETFGTMTLEDALYDTMMYWENGRRQILDKDKLTSTINSQIDEEGFTKWLKDNFSDIKVKSGIYNGKDIFTPSGSRRSFDSLHDSWTLQNIFKSMAREIRENGGMAGSNGGVLGTSSGQIIAKVSPQFETLNDIIKNEYRIAEVDQDAYEEYINKMNGYIQDVVQKIDEEGVFAGSSDNMFEVYSYGYDFIADVITKNNTDQMWKTIKNDWYTKKTREQLEPIFKDILELKGKLTTIESKYFEAKPQRIVPFTEIKQAIVPNNISESTKQRLADDGIEVIEYDPKVEGERLARQNDSTGRYKFSSGLSLDDVKKLSPKSVNYDGSIKDLGWQISEMQKDPSTFGYGVVDVGNSLKFANIDADKIFFTNSELKNHIKKHINRDEEIAYVLDNVKDNAVLGLDYFDKISNKQKKSIYVQTDNGIYRIGIEQNQKKQLMINEISTMVEDNDFNAYYKKAIENGNAIYKNEKSDAFLGRFPNSLGSVSNITSNDIRTNKGDNVKKSNGISLTDINSYNKAVSNNDLETAQELVNKVAKEKGYSLERYYHASNSDSIKVFDENKIRANETDADYNGFWVTTDEDTLPAWVRSNRTYNLYIKYGNVATYDVYKPIEDKVWEEHEGNNYDNWNKKSRSVPDEVRYRLKDMGYNSIIHENPADVNYEELEKNGRAEFSDSRGRKWIIERDEDGYYDSYRYDKYEDDYSFYATLADPHELFSEKVVVLFDPNQLKSSDPITYDDNGNVISLEERFNSSNDDIRYSNGLSLSPTEKVIDSLNKNGVNLDVENNDDFAIIAHLDDIVHHYGYSDYIDATNKDINISEDSLARAFAKEYKKGDKITDIDWRKVVYNAVNSTNDVEETTNNAIPSTEIVETNEPLELTDEELMNTKVGNKKRRVPFVRETPLRVDNKVVDSLGTVKYREALEKANTLFNHTTSGAELDDAENYISKVYPRVMDGDAINVVEEYIEEPANNSTFAKGAYLAQLLYDNEMYDLYDDVLTKINTTKSEAGQILESTKRIYEMNDPVSKGLFANVVEANMQAETDAKYGKGKYTIDLSPYYDSIMKAKTDREFKKAVSNAIKSEMNKLPQTLGDKINAYRYWAMLSSPRTAIRNFTANEVNKGVYSINNITKAFVEGALNVPQDERTSVKRLDRNKSKVNKEIARKIWEEIKPSENTKYNISETQRSIPSILQGIEGKMLSDERAMRNYFVYQMNVTAQARGIDLATIDRNSKAYNNLEQYAMDKAKEVVHHNKTSLARTLDNIDKLTSKSVQVNKDSKILHGVDTIIKDVKEASENGNVFAKTADRFVRVSKKVLMPFTRTNASVIQKAYEFSPIGMTKAIVDYKNVTKGKMSTEEYVDRLSKGLTGTGVIALATILGTLGLIRWEKDDDDYSGRLAVMFGDKGYTIDFLDPVSLMIAKGVALSQELTENGVELSDIGKVLRDNWDIFVNDELNMFSNTLQLVDKFKDAVNGENDYGGYGFGDFGGDVIFTVVNQFIPSIVRDVTRTFEPNKKRTYTDSVVETTFNRFVNNTPFRFALEDKTNAQGEPVKYTQNFTGNSVFDAILTNLISPGNLVEGGKTVTSRGTSKNNNLSKENTSEYDRLAKLYPFEDKDGDNFDDDNLWLRTSTPEKLYFGTGDDKKTVKMSNEARTQYGSIWSNIWTSCADYTMSTSEFKELSDKDKAKTLYNIQQIATRSMSAEYGYQNNEDVTDTQANAYELIRICTGSDGKINGEKLSLINLAKSSAYKQVDENGKTIRNSNARGAKEAYQKAGIYDEIVEYIQKNNADPSDFGLTKTVINEKDETSEKPANKSKNSTTAKSNASNKIVSSEGVGAPKSEAKQVSGKLSNTKSYANVFDYMANASDSGLYRKGSASNNNNSQKSLKVTIPRKQATIDYELENEDDKLYSINKLLA